MLRRTRAGISRSAGPRSSPHECVLLLSFDCFALRIWGALDDDLRYDLLPGMLKGQAAEK